MPQPKQCSPAGPAPPQRRAPGSWTLSARCTPPSRRGQSPYSSNERVAITVGHRPGSIARPARGLGPAALVDACVRLRPTADAADPNAAAGVALRSLGRRHRALTGESEELDAQLKLLVDRACPALIAMHGVGYETAAQLITAGDNPDKIGSGRFRCLVRRRPIPASSGKARRHRLSRGGDGQVNRALHLIACTRLATCRKHAPTATDEPNNSCPQRTWSDASGVT